MAALWFVVVLSRLLRDAMVGGAGAIAIELVVVAVHSATFVDGNNTVQLRTMLTAIDRELVVLELLPRATFFAAVAAVSLRHRALPGWLGWSAGALALSICPWPSTQDSPGSTQPPRADLSRLP